MKTSSTKTGIFNPHFVLAFSLCSVGALLGIASLTLGSRNAIAQTTGSDARILVTTTVQKIGGIGTGGCSLQEAIYSSVLHNSFDGTHGIAIDATDPDHFITTECVLGTGSGDTIVLPSGGVFNLNKYLDGDAHNPYGLTATPIIFSTMTIPLQKPETRGTRQAKICNRHFPTPIRWCSVVWSRYHTRRD